MLKYDDFEFYLIRKMYTLTEGFSDDDNAYDVNLFAELMETLVKYENVKEFGNLGY